MHGVARQAWPRVGRDGDEEFRRAVLGDAVGRRRRVAPAAVALALHADGISAERQVGLQRERLVGRAERRYGDGRVLEDAVLAIAEHPAQRVAARGRTQRPQRAVAHDRFRVDRLAGTVDTAFGEHRGGFGAALVAPRRLDVELPGREVGVPAVHGHHGAVRPEGRRHVPVEPPAASVLALVALRSRGRPRRGVGLQPAEAGEPLGVGDGVGARLSLRVVERDARPAAGLAVADARDPHHGFGEADAGVDGEVRDLHHRQRLPAVAGGVDAGTGDADQLQRPGSRARGVGRGQAHTRYAGHVGAVDDAEAPPHRGRLHERGPEVGPRTGGRERPRLERLRHSDDGDVEGVHVDVLHRQGARAVALDEHAAVRVAHGRRVRRRRDGLRELLGETLAEHVRHAAVDDHQVAAARLERRVEGPGITSRVRVADGDRHRRDEAHATRDFRPLHRCREREVDRADGTGVVAVRAPGFLHRERTVRAEPEQPRGRHAVDAGRGAQRHVASQGQGRDRGELHDAVPIAHGIGREAPVPAPALVRVGDAPLALDLDANLPAPARARIEAQRGLEQRDVRRATEQQLEASVGREPLRAVVRRHVLHLRAAHAEREAVRPLEAAAVERLERGRDGDGVRRAGRERRDRSEANRHRIAPLDSALDARLDAEDQARIHRRVQPGRDGAIEGHGDRVGRLALPVGRHAQYAQRLDGDDDGAERQQQGCTGGKHRYDLARGGGDALIYPRSGGLVPSDRARMPSPAACP